VFRKKGTFLLKYSLTVNRSNQTLAFYCSRRWHTRWNNSYNGRIWVGLTNTIHTSVVISSSLAFNLQQQGCTKTRQIICVVDTIRSS